MYNYCTHFLTFFMFLHFPGAKRNLVSLLGSTTPLFNACEDFCATRRGQPGFCNKKNQYSPRFGAMTNFPGGRKWLNDIIPSPQNSAASSASSQDVTDVHLILKLCHVSQYQCKSGASTSGGAGLSFAPPLSADLAGADVTDCHRIF